MVRLDYTSFTASVRRGVCCREQSLRRLQHRSAYTRFPSRNAVRKSSWTGWHHWTGFRGASAKKVSLCALMACRQR